jgi:hypothetical protein
VPNRSDFGQITFRDWFSTGAFESGYIAPDLLNPRFVYSIGWYGSVFRLDRTTGQISTVFAPGPKYRYTWETPLVFSPVDRKTLYLGMQHLLKTSDGAQTWAEISPDLTAKSSALAHYSYTGTDDDDEDQPQRAESGVIEAIAPSPLKAAQVWVGTSSGLVQLTPDSGATWRNVTPKGLPDHCRISRIEASPVDPSTAYAVASVRNDRHPYIYRTRDAGKSWQSIVAGLPDDAGANVVREDPVRKGLLFAGTDSGAYVSFNGGDTWQPLQLNLPVSPVRDLTVHQSDLVAATYGRGLWILDNLSPLRQVDVKVADSRVFLFHPETALRVRWDNWEETPLSAETPAGENPPDGAIIDYYLESPKEITLEIRDDHNNVVRKFSSAALAPTKLLKNVPDFWFPEPEVLPAKAGQNRFVWDLRLAPPAALSYNFYGKRIDYVEYTLPDGAVPGHTPLQQPPGPLVVPGNYEVILTVDGKTYRQPLTVSLDPRLQIPQADLQAQFELARKISEYMTQSYEYFNHVSSLQALLSERQKVLSVNSGPQAAKDALALVTSLSKELEELKEGTSVAPGFGSANRDLSRFLSMIEIGDSRPAETARTATQTNCDAVDKALAHLRKINSESLPALNALLKQVELQPVPALASLAQR